MTNTNKTPPDGYLPRDRGWHPAPHYPAYKTSITRSPRAAPLSFPSGLSEETGPVFSPQIIGPLDQDLTRNFAAPGETAIGPRIIVYGQVRDQTGRGIPDALLEVWQANAGGRYRHKNEGYQAALDPNFGGCGRVITDADGHYKFRTIMPAPYPWPNGPNAWRPAHIHFSLFGAGFAQRLITQMYFEGDPLIARCPIVASLSNPEAVRMLIAPLDMDRSIPMDARAYRFDITLRGRDQTPFANRAEGM
ncbi:protocatechuate 3,4-dioxygenase subunit beta [Rhodophyticola sp. CCM32]|uniref:protocatechuate 3,4-dioxygenase subunit beta n=1 Tax=Rhodophyticola sp. CCM32 TaxID=2916397 RepID=UPI00107F521B|nr:protocatechuate 3,4-dioxygenase subunit beta [Rhodophyticola sp. CCM32]QBX99413.1 protocatechuate 3,4-dioxygenase subunit beta [Rhodophyticola sp. CCM32]